MGNAQVIVTVDEACAVDASPPPGLSEVWGVATDYTVLGLLARSTKGGREVLCYGPLGLSNLGESLQW
jgi:hypothetical protein